MRVEKYTRYGPRILRLGGVELQHEFGRCGMSVGGTPRRIGHDERNLMEDGEDAGALGELLTRDDVCHVHADRAAAER